MAFLNNENNFKTSNGVNSSFVGGKDVHIVGLYRRLGKIKIDKKSGVNIRMDYSHQYFFIL
ncbi:hypothetical protein KJ575_02665 [Patescibacteria group bacterium]|nr:hypothetical protein [Patescibacteria group bacterium]